MAGQKGRSGGARVGSGGPRPGAGRKPKSKASIDAQRDLMAAREAAAAGVPGDPDEFLLAAQLGTIAPTPIQMQAALARMPYKHAKLGETGKKADAADAAVKAADGRFARSAPPQQPLFGSQLN